MSNWFRIDKADGTISVASSDKVFRSAESQYHEPTAVVAGGRFSTPFAIYSRADMLLTEERIAVGDDVIP